MPRSYHVNKLRAPLALEELVQRSFDSLHGPPPEAIADADLLEGPVAPNPPLVQPAGGDPAHLSGQPAGSDPAQSSSQPAGSDPALREWFTGPTGELKHIAKQAFRLASEGRQQRFENCHSHLAGAMDAHFRGARSALRTALARQDSNLFWKLFWHNVEESIFQFTSHVHDCSEHHFLGRGNIRVRKEQQHPRFANHLDGNCERPLPS